MNVEKVLKVWIDGSPVGSLTQEGRKQYVFGYNLRATKGVSLTMPVRLQSWVSEDLHPIFQMNLPEGALLEAIRRAIAKIIGDDDLSLLSATGGNQVGRNRFSLRDEKSPASVNENESLEELLTYPDTKELFHELLDRYALHSGVSGVQPKVLLDATERGTLTSSGYIVKTWGSDYPQLAANEYFCMTAAKKAGLPVPEFSLSDNGGLFVMRRFDQTPDDKFLGFEDMCSLQALGTAQKYRGTYERVAKSLKEYVSGEFLLAARQQFFATLVLSSMVKNGDAHLKNFAVLYPSLTGSIKMAPVFDIVTTTAYLRHDVPALSLAGTKKWWPRKMLEKFAMIHLSLPVGEINRTIERLADAVMETRRLIPGYIADHPEFREVGGAMMEAWDEGVGGF
ncbi:MAG: type II toxin-antitoxin system HipA family toxin [Desulfuromusa sp.]|nr:type II toxin-antitoxin system HipA family toxin [Desulfuromusa sp.]